jgi:hypothetical protein
MNGKLKVGLVICFTTGILVALGFMAYKIARLNARNSQLEAENGRLKREPAELRALAETNDAGTVGTVLVGTEFAQLDESAIPGKYRFFIDGKQTGTVVLHSDHTFTDLGGQTKPHYKWRLTAQALVMLYAQRNVLFTHVVQAGVYEGVRTTSTGRQPARIEKIP